MRESHIEGVATHDDPESCVVDRKVRGEALTGACAGTVLSREIKQFRVPTLLTEAEGHTGSTVTARYCPTLRGRRPVARTEPLCARTGRSHLHPSRMARRVALERPKAVPR